MASARIHRQSCEAGRLPPICICCGSQATQRVRNVFNCEPTWQIAFLPVILLIMLVVGVFTGLKLKRLYNPLAADPIQFSVPVCDEHHARLTWHRYFLWALVALLLLAMAVLLPLSISIAANRGQDVSGQMRLMEGAVIASLVLGAMLLLASMAIRLMTPRVIYYTPSYIDMASLAPEFVDAVRRTSTSNVAGYGQSMGVPLTAGMNGALPSKKSMVIVGGATLALASCCLLVTVALPALMRWNSKQVHARIRADMDKHLEQTEARKQQSQKSPTVGSVSKKQGSSGPPSFASLPPSLPPAAPPPGSAPSAATQEPATTAPAPTVGSGAETTSSSPKRLDEFKSFSSQKFPPNSREVRDSSELHPGMEVWAYRPPTWYRAKVTRMEGRMMPRIKFPTGKAGPPEMPVPVAMLRIPTD